MTPSFFSVPLETSLTQRKMFLSYFQTEDRRFMFIFSSIIIPGWHQTGQLHAGQGHRIEVASGEEAVNSLLTRRLRLPETHAHNPQVKAKPVMTNKLSPGYTEMESADVFAVRFQTQKPLRCPDWITLVIFTAAPGLPIHWGRPGPSDKRSTLWALCCTWRADARQGEFYTHQWLLKLYICEKTAQISTILV